MEAAESHEGTEHPTGAPTRVAYSSLSWLPLLICPFLLDLTCTVKDLSVLTKVGNLEPTAQLAGSSAAWRVLSKRLLSESLPGSSALFLFLPGHWSGIRIFFATWLV